MGKLWVSTDNSDSFSGIEIDESMLNIIERIKDKYEEEDAIDCVFDDYKSYRNYEVEYASQARHGSDGTEIIETVEELKEYFSWLDLDDII